MNKLLLTNRYLSFFHLKCGCSRTDGFQLGTSQLGSLFSFLQLLLGLAVFCQVKSSNFFSLFNLSLVGLDLLLQLVGQVTHTILVLAVFFLLELQFLDTPLSTLECLEALTSLGLSRSKFHFKLADPHFQLGHGILASLHGMGFSISQASLQFAELSIKCPLGSGLSVDMVLFSSELISQPSSINHGSLGFLLRVLGILEGLINLGLESMDNRFQATLVMHSLGVDDLHLIDSSASIRQFRIQLALSTLSRIQKSTRLLNLTTESIGLAFSNANSLHDFLALTGLFLKSLDGFAEVSLVTLDGLLAFSVSLVGMVKGNLKLIDVRLKLLLDAKSFSLGTLLCFKRSSKRLHGTLVVLPGIIKLLFLLLDPAVDLLTDLAELKLSPQDLVLLLFKSSLSLFQSSLELFLLNFQASALLVKLMDGPASISKLIQKILDFISQVLVFPLDNIKLLNHFIMSSLESEKLAVVVAAFLLAGFNLGRHIISLGFPFTNDFVEVLATLLSDDGSSVGPLVFH